MPHINTLRWIICALALLQGAWLAADGYRALVVGDYVTPSSGARAGQLGPWTHIVSAVGLEPRGTFIKSLHAALGLAWLIALIFFVVRPTFGWWALFGCAVGTLWYLPIGTIVGVIVIALLFATPLRNLS
jgi:hypothetical protein